MVEPPQLLEDFCVVGLVGQHFHVGIAGVLILGLV